MNLIAEHEFRGHKYIVDRNELFLYHNEMESRDRFLNLTPEEVFIDVGAAFGSWAIPAALTCREVLAVEPHARFSILLKNMEYNGISNVRLVPKILWDERVSGLNFDGWAVKSDGTPEMPSEGYTLDSVVDEYHVDRVDMIKIDVEGSEMRVLKGAIKTINQHKPRVLVEVHTQMGVKLEPIVEFFGQRDFRYAATIMPQGPWGPTGFYYHAFFQVRPWARIDSEAQFKKAGLWPPVLEPIEAAFGG